MLASFISLYVIWGQLHCLCQFPPFNTGMVVILPVVVVKIRYNDFEVLQW